MNRWASQRARSCAVCGRRGRPFLHHVVYQQHVRVAGGDVRDPRCSLSLCLACHTSHHDRTRPVDLYELRDENYEFAAELLGEAAHDYLARRYAGRDQRHDRLLPAEGRAA